MSDNFVHYFQDTENKILADSVNCWINPPRIDPAICDSVEDVALFRLFDHSCRMHIVFKCYSLQGVTGTLDKTISELDEENKRFLFFHLLARQRQYLIDHELYEMMESWQNLLRIIADWFHANRPRINISPIDNESMLVKFIQ